MIDKYAGVLKELYKSDLSANFFLPDFYKGLEPIKQHKKILNRSRKLTEEDMIREIDWALKEYVFPLKAKEEKKKEKKNILDEYVRDEENIEEKMAGVPEDIRKRAPLDGAPNFLKSPLQSPQCNN